MSRDPTLAHGSRTPTHPTTAAGIPRHARDGPSNAGERVPETHSKTLEGGTDLETVLAAWHTATLRLEQTHEALRAEVRRLTDELEVKNRQLARKNRLADLGQMASHIAHEVRNNLVPVTLYLSLLRRRITHAPGNLLEAVVDGLPSDSQCPSSLPLADAHIGDVLDKIEASFASLDATVNDLLHFTCERDPQRQPCALVKLIDDVLASVTPQLRAQAIRTVREIDDRLCLSADRNMLRRAVLNLILNALDAMPDGGTLTLGASADPEEVRIQVADTGQGLSEEAVRRAFEPFYTTKPGGTGLGLAIVYRIAEVHGGGVTARNRPEGGAEFVLSIGT
jgi:signal transduction histidine kinase